MDVLLDMHRLEIEWIFSLRFAFPAQVLELA